MKLLTNLFNKIKKTDDKRNDVCSYKVNHIGEEKDKDDSSEYDDINAYLRWLFMEDGLYEKIKHFRDIDQIIGDSSYNNLYLITNNIPEAITITSSLELKKYPHHFYLARFEAILRIISNTSDDVIEEVYTSDTFSIIINNLDMLKENCDRLAALYSYPDPEDEVPNLNYYAIKKYILYAVLYNTFISVVSNTNYKNAISPIQSTDLCIKAISNLLDIDTPLYDTDGIVNIFNNYTIFKRFNNRFYYKNINTLKYLDVNNMFYIPSVINLTSLFYIDFKYIKSHTKMLSGTTTGIGYIPNKVLNKIQSYKKNTILELANIIKGTIKDITFIQLINCSNNFMTYIITADEFKSLFSNIIVCQDGNDLQDYHFLRTLSYANELDNTINKEDKPLLIYLSFKTDEFSLDHIDYLREWYKCNPNSKNIIFMVGKINARYLDDLDPDIIFDVTDQIDLKKEDDNEDNTFFNNREYELGWLKGLNSAKKLVLNNLDKPYIERLAKTICKLPIDQIGKEDTNSNNLEEVSTYDLSLINLENNTINNIVEGFKRSVNHHTFKRLAMIAYGGSGNGKSMFATHLSNVLGKKLVTVSGSDILSKWVGESESNVASMFSKLNKDTILLVDEADALMSSRETDGVKTYDKHLTNEWLVQLERFEGILIITTNHIKDMDKALLRRFTIKVEFKDLKEKDYEKAILPYIKTFKLKRDIKLSDAVKKLYGLRLGDINNVSNQVLFYNVTKLSDFINRLCLEIEYRNIEEKSNPIGFK